MGRYRRTAVKGSGVNLQRKGRIAFAVPMAFFCSVCFGQQQGTVTYVYTDPQGTPLAETDANGNITATYDYTPYGTTSLGSSPNGPGYTGHVNDPETNLVYMQARYYDSATGRFLSVDPVSPNGSNPSKFNRYDYANNNPIANIDPDGRDILVIAGGRNTGSLNVFGHVASAIQGYGVASYGNDTRLGSPASQYIQSQSVLRNQTVTVITTTPAQDAKAVSFINSEQSENTASLIDNCAVKTNLIINAAGVATDDIPFPGGTSRDVSSLPGTTTYFIPRNGTIPKGLQAILNQYAHPQSNTPAPTPTPTPSPTPTPTPSPTPSQPDFPRHEAGS